MTLIRRRFLSTVFLMAMLLVSWCSVVYAQHGVIDYYASLAPSLTAQPLAPLTEYPLTDTSITLGGDGYYYKTGSLVEGDKAIFSKLISIRRSADLKSWETVRVLTFVDTAVSSPEIHWLNGAFYMTLGREDGGGDLLKFDSLNLTHSTFQKVTITDKESDPSIFLDDDGTFYWVCGAGYIGKMKPNPLNGLVDGMKRAITPYPERAKNNQAGRLVRSTQMRGAFLTKINGFYHLFVSERRLKFKDFGRTGLPGGTDDVFVAVSSKPDEGYDEAYRYLAFPSAGQTTLFRDKEDKLWATFSCTDTRGIFRFKPGAFPVEIVDASQSVWATGFAGQDEPVLYAPHKILLRPSREFVYENGVGLVRSVPFDKVPGQQRPNPWIRDTNITLGGDGNYYMTGTAGDMNAVHIWKSTDMKKFDYFAEAFKFKTPQEDPEAWYNQKPERLLWAPEIHFRNGNYWIVFSVNSGLGMGFLKSATGKPEGPYVPTYEGNRAFVVPNIDSSLFVDSDGSAYYVWQGKFLQRLNSDFSQLEGERIELLTTDKEQVGYEGIFMIKYGDWYVLCAAEWNGGANRMDGTYDTMYAVSKTLQGPYSPRRVLAPHTGHSTLFQDTEGRWHMSFFGNDRTAPFRASVGIVPLVMKEMENDLVIEIEKR
jgi:beta-xylosidase